MLFLLFVRQQLMAGNNNFLVQCTEFCQLFRESKEKLLWVSKQFRYQLK